MTFLSTAILVMIGGGLGSVSRYLVGEMIVARRGPGSGARFPTATVIVNLLGSFVLGLVAGLADLESLAAPAGLALAGVGFCGGFTTFSTFAVDIVALIEDSAWELLSGYLLSSLLGGLAMAALGFAIVIFFS